MPKAPSGMLIQGAARWSVALEESFMVGDRWRDIDAGAARAAARCWLIAGGPNVSRTTNPMQAWTRWSQRLRGYSPRRGNGCVEGCRLESETLCSRSRQGRHSQVGSRQSHRRLHNQSYADAQGRDFRLRELRSQYLDIIDGRPISYEVFADDFVEMRRQALKIAKWGENVYVKIPITNTKAQSSAPLVRELSDEGVKLNVTALMTDKQVEHIAEALTQSTGAYISVFAGRVADTGRDPLPIMQRSLAAISGNQRLELIWASPRELLNVFQANEAGVHIIQRRTTSSRSLTSWARI